MALGLNRNILVRTVERYGASISQKQCLTWSVIYAGFHIRVKLCCLAKDSVRHVLDTMSSRDFTLLNELNTYTIETCLAQPRTPALNTVIGYDLKKNRKTTLIATAVRVLAKA